MLARRVILILQFNDGVLFRTKKFVPDYRYTQAFSWSGDADELVFIDITRKPTAETRKTFLKTLEKYARNVDIPITTGGNLENLRMCRENCNTGCETVLIGYGRRHLYEEVAGYFGCQALMAGIDHEKLDVWTRQATIREGIDVSYAAEEAARLGAGQILLTSIERDGSLGGFDLPVLSRVRQVVSVPIIVAGGCGSWGHIREAFQCGADAAATSNVFHWSQTAMRACKVWLKQNYDGEIREAA